MRLALPNPAWSNCALLRSWDALAAHVGPRMMPRVTRHTLEHLDAVEYGHGVYGVVLPTAGAPGWVCKVTSDPSEAHTAAVLRSLRARPAGIVRYGAAFRLPGRRKGNDIYVLWREEAFDVGRVFGRTEEDRAARGILDAFFDETAATCRVACSPRASARELAAVRSSAARFRGATGYGEGQTPGLLDKARGFFTTKTGKAGRGLAAAEDLARDLAELPKYRPIARALLDLMRAGVLVTDVHSGNFGYAQRGGRRVAVITDPGNVAFVTTRFDRVAPPDVLDGLSAAVRARAEANARQARCAV